VFITSLAALRTGIFSREKLRCAIPLGSVEFVEAVMNAAFGIQRIQPQNPDVIFASNRELLGRNMELVQSIDDVHSVMDRWNVSSGFIKSASCVKCNFSGIYKRTDTLPYTADTILVSSCVNFVTEWRIFVFNGSVGDARRYAGDPWQSPDAAAVETMVKTIGRSLPAYALDIGLLDTGETVAVEVHNFLACGLYGAELPLGMYIQAYKYEVGRSLSRC